ncbi:gp16 family protein [Vacuolonema iberomarrocanum]|uniref:gp16 family protein n=1 Tax=Vacuolonema iberomarrocanum TaxID=3454632 RepID=UPI0019EED794|nr:regulatory protein GemA [filamentous cyanobacterium LEGE 07170]
MTTPPGQRKRLLALIHIAKKQFGMDEDGYRDFLEAQTGKRSAGKMNLSELNQVFQGFEARGFKVTGETGLKGEGSRVKGERRLSPKTRDKDPEKKTPADKVRALWIECWKAGKVKSRYDDSLQAYCKRVTKVERVEWLNHAQARQMIKILEDMLKVPEREAEVSNEE